MSAYDDAVRRLYGLSPRGIELGLARMEEALAIAGHPERSPRFVHVAGTNGKGSVSAVVERILREAGLVTGLYTSPHLHRVVERIRIRGREMSDAALVRAASALEDPRLPPLTFFEAITWIGFREFARRRADVVVLEVGLGGRLDATNVVVPEVAVVTNIGLEHTAWLGTTHAAIAAEKAAIAREGRPLVHGVDVPEARAVVEARARAIGADLIDVHREASCEDRSGEVDATIRGHRFTSVPVRLRGVHQRTNLLVALATIAALRERGFAIPDAAVRAGASKVRWPGRIETLRRRPEVIVDGAHNPDGCVTLAAHLATLPRRTPTVLVFGAMADKELGAMLGAFDGVVDERVYVAPDLARAATPDTFARIRPGERAPKVGEGVRRAIERAGASGRVVVAGSLFVVASARAELLGLRVDPPIAM